MCSLKQDYSPSWKGAMKFSYSTTTETKNYSISVGNMLRDILKSSFTTVPASPDINALISYMKIKLESCRTVEVCQNTSISSFILCPTQYQKSITAKPHRQTCWWYIWVWTYMQTLFAEIVNTVRSKQWSCVGAQAELTSWIKCAAAPFFHPTSRALSKFIAGSLPRQYCVSTVSTVTVSVCNPKALPMLFCFYRRTSKYHIHCAATREYSWSNYMQTLQQCIISPGLTEIFSYTTANRKQKISSEIKIGRKAESPRNS